MRTLLLILLLATGNAIPQRTPGRRVDPEMFYHDRLQKIVMIDGTLPNFDQPERTELWTWDGEQWSKLNVEGGPGGRYASCAVYDSKRNAIVSFGGRVGKNENIRADTWEWDGKSWKEISDPFIKPRDHHSLVYNDVSGNVVLYGGGVFPRVPGPWATDTWVWDGSQWSRAATAGPPGRVTTMVYDEARREVIMFGGVGAPENGIQPKFSDTWSWNGKQWKQLAGDGPAPRSRHAMAYDQQRQVVVLYGGENDNGPLGDMWQWDGKRWSEIALDNLTPGSRYVHAMAYDRKRNVIVLYGGMHNKELMTDTWEWDGRQWKMISEGKK